MGSMCCEYDWDCFSNLDDGGNGIDDNNANVLRAVYTVLS